MQNQVLEQFPIFQQYLPVPEAIMFCAFEISGVFALSESDYQSYNLWICFP